MTEVPKSRRGRKSGVRAGLLAFFEANPDEELRMVDIETKWDVSEATAYETVRNLRDVLERVMVVRRKRA